MFRARTSSAWICVLLLASPACAATTEGLADPNDDTGKSATPAALRCDEPAAAGWVPAGVLLEGGRIVGSFMSEDGRDRRYFRYEEGVGGAYVRIRDPWGWGGPRVEAFDLVRGVDVETDRSRVTVHLEDDVWTFSGCKPFDRGSALPPTELPSDCEANEGGAACDDPYRTSPAEIGRWWHSWWGWETPEAVRAALADASAFCVQADAVNRVVNQQRPLLFVMDGIQIAALGILATELERQVFGPAGLAHEGVRPGPTPYDFTQGRGGGWIEVDLSRAHGVDLDFAYRFHTREVHWAGLTWDEGSIDCVRIRSVAGRD